MMEKTKLVLVPGLLCDAQLWRAQVEDCGHMSTMEKPGEVNQALRRWLAT